MKTWLTVDENLWVYRHNEYGDEPNWIGVIVIHEGNSWFKNYGDNRTLDLSELKQITEWVDNVIKTGKVTT